MDSVAILSEFLARGVFGVLLGKKDENQAAWFAAASSHHRSNHSGHVNDVGPEVGGEVCGEAGSDDEGSGGN